MGVIVTFDFAAFSAQWPAYVPVGSTLLASFFDMATTMHANDGSGPINNAAIQQKLLNALTAHLAQLYAPRDASGNPAATGAPAPALVGRMSSASEGSVSVQTEALQGFTTAQAAWLSQTQPGAFYWAMTAQFRTVRYVQPRCSRPVRSAFPVTFQSRS